MTAVTLLTGKDGVLKNCKANGHADFSRKGSDIVCSAVTILLKTAMKVLSQKDGVTLKADMSSRGNLAFCVEATKDTPETASCLKYTADFLRAGFESLSKEFPKNVSFEETVEAGNKN